MPYCVASDLRELVTFPSSVLDADLTNYITRATRELNKRINIRIREEEVLFIDDWRQNDIDGVNVTFFTRSAPLFFLGDLNNDGSVTTADVQVRQYNNDSTFTDVTPATVDGNLSRFTLTTAPDQQTIQRMVVTYAFAPLSESDPDGMIAEACRQLGIGMALTGIHANDFKNVSLGRLRASRGSVKDRDTPWQIYFDEAERLIRLIQSRILKRVPGRRGVLNRIILEKQQDREDTVLPDNFFRDSDRP